MKSNLAAVNPHDYSFCPKCGSSLKTTILEGVPRMQCETCLYIYYQNPIPAVGVIVQKDDGILLVKRKYKPKVGYWTLPAGFVEYSESIEQALIREVKEETNLDVEIGDLFDVCSAFDDIRCHVVLVIYLAKSVRGELKPGDDASDVAYFPLHDQLPEIAFSCHTKAIEKLQESMKIK